VGEWNDRDRDGIGDAGGDFDLQLRLCNRRGTQGEQEERAAWRGLTENAF
jgi:hypothetical protein